MRHNVGTFQILYDVRYNKIKLLFTTPLRIAFMNESNYTPTIILYMHVYVGCSVCTMFYKHNMHSIQHSMHTQHR